MKMRRIVVGALSTLRIAASAWRADASSRRSSGVHSGEGLMHLSPLAACFRLIRTEGKRKRKKREKRSLTNVCGRT
uniref:Putative secreted protein n=1 Tax=Anopheles triannulatus TaxID=58253 RepID=A0A2M4B6U5_9DIPT